MVVPPAQRGPEAAVIAQTAWIRDVVVRCGVPFADVEDVCQEVTLAAIVAIRAGRYLPPPDVKPRRALLAWLTGIAVHLLGHYWDKAYRRREIPTADPWARSEPEGASLDAQLDARRTLAAIDTLPRRLRDIALLAAQGHGLTGIARKLGLPISTVQNRLRAARLALGSTRPPRSALSIAKSCCEPDATSARRHSHPVPA
jgi:DNA-directed RNA polymerase specialized sigma24 family protein